VRFWNVGRAAKNLVRGGMIRWRCPAAGDDTVAIERLKEFQPLFEGKAVALVGNAQSLFGAGLGAEIESCDVVARVNFGVVRSPADQGARTDALFLATGMGHSVASRLFGCDRFIWVSSKRSTIALGFLLRPQSIAFAPFQDIKQLADRLQARPSAGVVALHLLLDRFGAEEVRLYGFDWKDTRTFYEDRVQRNVHAWEHERELVESLAGELRGRLVIRRSERAG
jgi:hypothetical protein